MAGPRLGVRRDEWRPVPAAHEPDDARPDWEGGFANRDCESTYLQFPPPRTSYSVQGRKPRRRLLRRVRPAPDVGRVLASLLRRHRRSQSIARPARSASSGSQIPRAVRENGSERSHFAATPPPSIALTHRPLTEKPGRSGAFARWAVLGSNQ